MQDNSVIVYYSWVGNTEIVAKEIQRLTGFDIQRIEEKRLVSLGILLVQQWELSLVVKVLLNQWILT